MAARLLWTSGTRPGVFDAFLRNFVETYPYSEYAFRRHGRDPCVIPVLLSRLDEEERRATEHGRYSPAYETVARYLVRLGQPIGRA